MAILEEKLFQPHGHPPSRVAVFGLGGMGKSRTAVELAYATKNQRPTYSVFWVQATDHLTFEKDILEIGKTLNVPGIQDEKADVKNLVKQYLSQDSAGNWLMILDNADDEGIWGVPAKPSANWTALAESLPKCTTGRILVTTRSRRVAVYMAGKEVVELAEMNQTEAAETFLGLLSKPEAWTDVERTHKLVERLTYLPLAIVQAAAFINMNDTSAQTYLDLLDDTEENIIDLLSEDFSDDEQRFRKGQNPVASTWLISFDQMRIRHPLAADYLAFTSCLSEKNIPLSFLPKASSKKKMTEAQGILTGYSFLRKQDDGQDQSKEVLYQMHRLVRLATRNWLRKEDTLLHWTKEAVGVVAERLPWREHENRDQCALCMPHAQILRTSEGIEDSEELYLLLEKVGWNFFHDGKYSEAVQLLASVVSWRETRLGHSHINTSSAYCNLGRALRVHGDWSEAKAYLEKALAGLKEILGAEHKDTIQCMSQLGKTYQALGNWEIAEELGEQVIRMRKEVLGAEHQETLDSMANLAWIFYRQKQYQKAEELGLRVMETRLKLFKEEHPDTLGSMGDLATIYRELGRLKEAEELDTKAFQTRGRSLGREHPDTLGIMRNLAVTYFCQGRLEEAEHLELEAFETSARTLGSENHYTLVAMNNLAVTWHRQGRLKEAVGLMEKCISLSIKKLGYDHPFTQERLSNLPHLRIQGGSGSGSGEGEGTEEGEGEGEGEGEVPKEAQVHEEAEVQGGEEEGKDDSSPTVTVMPTRPRIRKRDLLRRVFS
jgi:tetratricopeptide (TPR) repeat protein